MIQTIVNYLKDNYLQLPFVDTLGGVITVLRQSLPVDGGKTKVNIFPAVLNEDKQECNNFSEYIAMIPDSTKKGMIYFEAQNVSITKSDYHNYKASCKVKLIFWCNLNKINKAYINADIIMMKIMSAIPQRIANIGNYDSVNFNFLGNSKTASLFSAYTYKEEERQYLMFPYDYFALDYEITWNCNNKCFDEVIINPATC